MRAVNELALGICLLFAAGCAQPERKAYRAEPAYRGKLVDETDRSLETSLRTELNKYGDLAASASNVQIYARNGTVTLAGTVPGEREKQMIEAVVRNASGVIALNDQLQVSYSPTAVYGQPARVYSSPSTEFVTAVPGDILNLRVEAASETDRAVAQRIVESLRTDTVRPKFLPTLSISVNAGRANLRGTVENEQQRRAIVSAVQHTPGVSGVYDELQVR